MADLSSEDRAISVICTKCFHQALWLPETVHHPKLKVTFSTTTNFDNINLPVILFIGPMFGTRYNSLHFDKLARDSSVRLICIDRPSFGGSTPVHLEFRVRVWLETVPVLLQHLNIAHVSLVTHSAGTIYTLNTLLHHRDLLSPTAPYVVFLAPFVSTEHTGAPLTTVASKLPTSIINSYSSLATFVTTNVLPSASWSGGIIASAAAALTASSSPGADGAPALPPSTPLEQYGFDEETAKHIEKLAVKSQFAENMSGADEELKLCLRKGGDASWGEAVDYAKCVRRIAANEEVLLGGRREAARLIVNASFTGSDVMIGKRGQEYFENCWREGRGMVDFTTKTFVGTDHDAVLVDLRKGALRGVFETVGRGMRVHV